MNWPPGFSTRATSSSTALRSGACRIASWLHTASKLRRLEGQIVEASRRRRRSVSASPASLVMARLRSFSTVDRLRQVTCAPCSLASTRAAPPKPEPISSTRLPFRSPILEMMRSTVSPAGGADIPGLVVEADMDILAAPDGGVEIVGILAVVIVAGGVDARCIGITCRHRSSPQRERRSRDRSPRLPPGSRHRNGSAGSRHRAAGRADSSS